MAQQYLDKTGLAYFWSKIKAMFQKKLPYCTCTTAAATAAKTTTLVSGSFAEDDLVAGAQVYVKFTYANGVANPTLSVNGTTAKSIKRYGTTAPSTSAATSWNAGAVVQFIYDGTYWVIDGWLNTTYSEISAANATNATGSGTGLASGRRLKAAVEAFAPVTSVNGETGDVTVTVPTKTSDLTNDSGFITDAGVTSFNGSTGAVTYTAPVTSVNGNTGDVTLTVGSMSDASNYIQTSMIDDYLVPKFYATDSTSQTVLQQLGGSLVDIETPKSLVSFGLITLLIGMNPRYFYGWMNGTELELARLDISVDTTTSTATVYLRGRTSMASGKIYLSDVESSDTSWTVTPYSSAVELVRW